MLVYREEQHFLKHLSKLKAILGRYPKSSKKVNKGKKIAIGGSITLITEVNVIYIPSINKLVNHGGEFRNSNNIYNLFCIYVKKLDNNCDG